MITRRVLYTISALLLIALIGAGVWKLRPPVAREPTVVTNANAEDENAPTPTDTQEPPEPTTTTVDFANTHSTFRFAGELAKGWEVEYRGESDALTIYDHALPANTALEQSHIFIRKFEANSFLTLSTVTIHSREQATVNGHDAVRYDIEKKPDVADFPGQPSWRNARHKLIDVRYTSNNPSTFYVIAANPNLDEAVFESFIQSLVFHNDAASWQDPITRADERVTKKPFGIFVTPDDSPVQPERFTGYHNAVDYEALPGEEDAEVGVRAVCGGEILRVQTADGYGGLIVQSCSLDDEPVTVNYGHVDVGSATVEVGNYAAPETVIAHLGQGFSAETDGERKHLHLGIHKGATIDTRGYLPSESELASWIDFQSL